MTGSLDAGPDALALMRPEIVAAHVAHVTITRPAWLLTQWRLASATTAKLDGLRREWSDEESLAFDVASETEHDARAELRAWLIGLGIDPASLADCI